MKGNNGKYPYNSGRHLMAIIELFAYADESGIEELPPYCVVAGYIASPRTWDKFRRQWYEVLKDFSIDEFHAKEFFGRYTGKNIHHGKYAGWSDKKLEIFEDKLVDIIASHRLSPLGSVIDVPAFNQLTLGERRYLTGALIKNKKLFGTGSPNQPYYVPFKWYIQKALEYVDIGAKVHFVFDEHSQLSPYAVAMYEDLKEYVYRDPRLGGISFESSKDKSELQAADMFNYVTYTYAKAHGDFEKINQERAKAILILSKKAKDIGIHDAEVLERNLSQSGPEFRAYLHSIMK